LWGYVSFIRESVYHSPNQGFFKRNLETILVSSVTGFIGVMVGAVGSSLVEKIRLWF